MGVKLSDFNASESLKRLNPHLFGIGSKVEVRQQPKPEAALERHVPPKQGGKIRLVVSIIGLRRRILDDDNFTAGNKPLRDAIAATLGIDDGDKRIEFQYGQVKVQGEQVTIVKIDAITKGTA